MDIDLSFAATFSNMIGKEKKLRIARKAYAIIEAFGELISNNGELETSSTDKYQYAGSDFVITYSKYYSNNKQTGRLVTVCDKKNSEKKYYVAQTDDYCAEESRVAYVPGDWENEFEKTYKRAYEKCSNQAKSMLETASDREKSLWGRFYITNDFELNVDIDCYIDELMGKVQTTDSDDSTKVISLGEGIYVMSNPHFKQVIVVDGSDAKVMYSCKCNYGYTSVVKSVPGYWSGRFGELAEDCLEKRKVKEKVINL